MRPAGPENPAVEPWLPRTLLLLGTDAAGKNHVAKVWALRMGAAGEPPILQEGWLAGPPVALDAEEAKSPLSHLAEWIFLRVFPWIARGMPPALNFLIRRDARRFRADGRRRLVISHSALRILAFCLAAPGRQTRPLPESSRRAIAELRRRSGARVVVLDVPHEVRRRRIEARLARDDSDPFDRFMLADGERSERIEACLVELAVEHLDAHLIVNDELDDDALWAELKAACA
ncbi:MAG: hypothetical protein AAF725_27685 [Acidobacteriota bacterium]